MPDSTAEPLAPAIALAEAAARAAGVTRVGELTHLDRLGVPVFHAVRPRSRALSVHQGKGLTRSEARLGALMEAIESAGAEDVAFDGCTRSWQDLPETERVCLSDFGAFRKAPPRADMPRSWIAGSRILDGRTLWIPVDAVSLDFTRPCDPAVQRSSNGQAAHLTPEKATIAALLEVIERDALVTWLAGSEARRGYSRISPTGIPYPWFRDLHERILRAGLWLSLFQLPSVDGLPALLAQIFDPAHDRGPRMMFGSACHFSPESALRAAVLEAVQSRATEISGARDDIGRSVDLGFAVVASPYVTAPTWDTVMADASSPMPGAFAMAARLAVAGYPDTTVVDLSPPGSAISVVKVFVPGLGAFERTRRPLSLAPA